jgi:three-Cys-motif partner protein
MPKDEDYFGREQSQVKHFILQRYLSAFANIIGSVWSTISYVDCFSGPWESHATDLSDTSFSIALSELRKARGTLRARGKTLSIRCMFLEKDPGA